MDNTGIQGLNLSDIGLHDVIQSEHKKAQRDEFLQLFVAQLRNQNPLDPKDGSEYLAQLAQFSTVEGIKNMEQSFAEIADSLNSSQSLQASSMVGRKVEVNSQVGILSDGESITGSIQLPAGVSHLAMEVYNEAGEIVNTYQLNAPSKGDIPFAWDGKNDKGKTLAPGVYGFRAYGMLNGEQVQFDTYIASNVDSVTIHKDGQPLTLNVSGFGKVSIQDVRTIS